MLEQGATNRTPEDHWAIRPTHECGQGGYLVEACPSGDYVGGHPMAGCGRAGCTDRGCVLHRGAERARRVRRRMEIGVTWHYVVLTCPPAVRAWLDRPSRVAEMRRAAIRMVAEVWRRRYHGIPGGLAVVHPEGEKAGWAPHVNILLPALTYHGEYIGYRHGGRLVPYPVLEDLREQWSRWCEQRGHVGPAVQVHVSYRAGRKQRAHVARYVTRTWPQYRAEVGRIVWWGFLAPHWRGPRPRTEDLDGEVPARTCPVCGRRTEIAAVDGPAGRVYHRACVGAVMMAAQRILNRWRC